MIETRTARLFRNGASQAVRLPAEFRFEGDEIYVSRDGTTGDVMLSTRPGAKTWSEFFELVRSLNLPDDLLVERPMNIPVQESGLFDEIQDGGC